MAHHARVHHRRGGIAVFVAEIGADQQLCLAAQRNVLSPSSRLDLVEPVLKNLFDLAVTVGKIAQHHGQFGPHRARI